MAEYHQAGFTIDPLNPIEDEIRQPAVGVDEYGFGDELAVRSDEYATTVAGPLTLEIEDSGLTLTATLGGADDATRAAIDWGDGDVSELGDERTAEHVYRLAGAYTVAAHATLPDGSYAVAKTRLMGSSP